MMGWIQRKVYLEKILKEELDRTPKRPDRQAIPENMIMCTYIFKASPKYLGGGGIIFRKNFRGSIPKHENFISCLSLFHASRGLRY